MGHLLGAVAISLLAALTLPAWSAESGGGTSEWIRLIVHPVRDPHTHELLRSIEGEIDPSDRGQVLRALGAIADPADRSIVRSHLADPEPEVRAQAVISAGSLGCRLSGEEAEALANDPVTEVRQALVSALPGLDLDGKKKYLERGIEDPASAVRAAAIQTAVQMDSDPGPLQARLRTENDPVIYHAIYRALVRLAKVESRLGLLRRGLADFNPSVIAEALRQLDEAEGTSLESEILEKLPSPYSMIQEEAVRAIQRTKRVAAVRLLPAMFDRGDPLVRQATCEAMGLLGGACEVSQLAGRLQEDPDPFVRAAAADALLQIHDETGQQALIGILKDKRADRRRESARVLGGWKQKSVSPHLHPLLDDDDIAVARAAAEALGNLQNDASRPFLLKRLESGPKKVQERVAWALGEFREKKAVPELLELTFGMNRQLETTSVYALGKIGDRSAIPTLRDILFDMRKHSGRVREAAVIVLHGFNDTNVIDRVFKLVTERVVPPPPGDVVPLYDLNEVRVAGMNYLAAFGDAAVGERLLERLVETPPSVIRPKVAETAEALTGRRYQPVPDQTYRRYFVESLNKLPYSLSPKPPGVVPVEGSEKGNQPRRPEPATP